MDKTILSQDDLDVKALLMMLRGLLIKKKINLVRITTKEINSIRPSCYKYLLP